MLFEDDDNKDILLHAKAQNSSSVITLKITMMKGMNKQAQEGNSRVRLEMTDKMLKVSGNVKKC